MAIKESDVSKAIRDWARDKHIMCERTNSGCVPLKGGAWMHLCSEGHPDLVMYLPAGRVLFIETKKPGGKTSPAQDEYHKKLEHNGHLVITISSFPDFISYFDRQNFL